MQNWQTHVERRGLRVRNEGRCQLCGSNVSNGLVECIEKSAFVPHRLSHDNGVKQMTLFLSVDAFALQHPEIQGPWSMHLHLSRLYLILVNKFQWDYRFTPRLSEVVDACKKDYPKGSIVIPPTQKRGEITISDVDPAASESRYIELVNEWALGVFESYQPGHEIARRIASEFVARV